MRNENFDEISPDVYLAIIAHNDTVTRLTALVREQRTLFEYIEQFIDDTVSSEISRRGITVEFNSKKIEELSINLLDLLMLDDTAPPVRKK